MANVSVSTSHRGGKPSRAGVELDATAKQEVQHAA